MPNIRLTGPYRIVIEGDTSAKRYSADDGKARGYLLARLTGGEAVAVEALEAEGLRIVEDDTVDLPRIKLGPQE